MTDMIAQDDDNVVSAESENTVVDSALPSILNAGGLAFAVVDRARCILRAEGDFAEILHLGEGAQVVGMRIDDILHGFQIEDSATGVTFDSKQASAVIAESLASDTPHRRAVIVTTPQVIALLDARKGPKMFENVEVPILGIVENMSTHICSQCGHEEHIFGEALDAVVGADAQLTEETCAFVCIEQGGQ